MIMLLFVLMLVSNVRCEQMFLVTPEASSVRSGGQVTLRCVVSGLGGQCYWTQDGRHVGQEHAKYTWSLAPANGDCSLTIHDASALYDDGQWQCQVSAADIVLGDSLISSQVSLTVISPPAEVSIIETNNTMECVTESSNPPSKLQISINEQLVDVNSEQENVRTQTGAGAGGWRSSLDITSLMVKANHAKTVKCLSIHDHSNTVLATSKILEIPFAPKILSASSDKSYYRSGETAVLQCRVESHPAAAVTWRHIDTGNVIGQSSELVIDDVDEESTGQYECEAENSEGVTISEPVSLDLIKAPTILVLETESERNINEGETLSLACNASAVPEAKFRWLHKTLTGDIVIVSEAAELKIKKTEYHNSGDYLCEASNMAGTALGDVIKVNILGAPKLQTQPTTNFTVIEGKSLKISLAICSNPIPEIELFKDGKSVRNIGLTKVKRNEDCIQAELSLHNIDNSMAGHYRLRVSNKLGNESVKFELHVAAAHEMSTETIIGICVGISMVVLTFICLLIAIHIVNQRRHNKSSEESVSSSVNTSSAPETSQHGSKEELLRCQVTLPQPSPLLYSQLNFPKSSNSGSMRKKKREHYQDLMDVYSTAIKHNLKMNDNTNRNVMIKYV